MSSMLLAQPRQLLLPPRKPIYGVYRADSRAKMDAWKAAGGTHVIIPAYWDRIQSAATGTVNAGKRKACSANSRFHGLH